MSVVFYVSITEKKEDFVEFPKVPELSKEEIETYSKAGVYIDTEIPRVVVSESLCGILQSLDKIIYPMWINKVRAHKELVLNVYSPEKDLEEYAVVPNSDIVDQRLVFNAFMTKEHWILEPVRFKKKSSIVIKNITIEDLFIFGAKSKINKGKITWGWSRNDGLPNNAFLKLKEVLSDGK